MFGLHYGNPRIVKLEVGLYHKFSNSHQEVFQGSEARDRTSSPKSQGRRVYDRASS